MRPRPVVGEATVPDAVRRLLDKFDYPDRVSEPQVVPILPTLGAGGGTGAFVHLSRAATQSIAVGGEAIDWDTRSVLGAVGFDPSVPTTTVTVQQTGYYNIAILAGWSSFTEGGTMSVVRTRAAVSVTVWPPADDPGLWTATDGDLFEGTAHAIQCETGDTLEVQIDADDAAPQTLESATLAVYLVDRAGSVSTYAELILSHGPLAYWRLDEASGSNAADSAGHASGPFHGTYTNTPDLGQTGVMNDGSGSPAVNFDGTKHVEGVDWSAMDFTSGAFSLEAWFIGDSISATPETLIEKQRTLSPNPGWELFVDDTGVVFNDDGNEAASRVLESGALTNGVTYHVVVTYDGSDASLMYLNGALVDSASGGITITANTITVSIGRDTGAGTANFDGLIDEVAVYDRALSAGEVNQHYVVGTKGI